MAAYISRVIRGECVWEYAPIAVEAIDDLLATDAFAHGELMGLIEDSQEPGGLGAAINPGTTVSTIAPPYRFHPAR